MAACSSGEHRLRLKQLSTFFRCPKSQITSVSACLCVCQRLTMEFHKDSPTSVALASSTNAWRRSTASPSSRTPAVSPASSSPPTKSATCKCNPLPLPSPPSPPPSFDPYDPIDGCVAWLVGRLGSVHDGSPPPSYLGGPGAQRCRWEDGYIMSDLRHTERGFKWSSCSISQFDHFLKSAPFIYSFQVTVLLS